MLHPTGFSMAARRALEAVFQFVLRIAEVLARGDASSLVAVGKLLTPQQAAD